MGLRRSIISILKNMLPIAIMLTGSYLSITYTELTKFWFVGLFLIVIGIIGIGFNNLKLKRDTKGSKNDIEQ